MTAPTVEAAIHELMDVAWNLVYGLLEERCLLGDGFNVEEFTGIHSWVDGLTRYTVVHSRTVAILFMDTRPVDAIVFARNCSAPTTRSASSLCPNRGYKARLTLAGWTGVASSFHPGQHPRSRAYYGP